MINKITKSFQARHESATAQWKKDLLLIGAVISCSLIRLLQASIVFIAFPFVMLAIGLWECLKNLASGFIAWFVYPWEDYLSYIPSYIKALRHIGKDTLPVNAKRQRIVG